MVNSTTVLRRPQPVALTRGGTGGRLPEVPVRTIQVVAVCGTLPEDNPTPRLRPQLHGLCSPDRDTDEAGAALRSGALWQEETMVTWDEKALEDWLCSTAGDGDHWRITEVLMGYLPPGFRISDFRSYAARQVSVPSGIIDILVQWEKHLYVCELKSVKADGNALSQVLAYCAHVEVQASPAGCMVHPVIIAPAFTDKLRWAASDGRVNLLKLSLQFTFSADKTDAWADDDSSYDDRLLKAAGIAAEWSTFEIEQELAAKAEARAERLASLSIDPGEPLYYVIHQP